MNIESFIQDIAKTATSINDMITKIYYPLGLYINLITKIDIKDLIQLLLINIIPFIIFIIIGSKNYFSIISSSKETTIKNKKKKTIIKRKQIFSLTKKEIKRYLSSPIYMFNTSFGLLLSIIVTIYLCIKGQDIFDKVLENYGINSNISLPLIFFYFILFVGFMTSISSSSISLEGKTINITKSLPIKENKLLNSKILTCFIIELPFIIFSSVLFFIKFRPNLFYIITILLVGILSVFINANVGLIINLKYPKMNATNDTEVVKQSLSSMVSVFIGMGIFFASILSINYLNKYLNIDLLLILYILMLTLISLVLYFILMKWGTKEYRKINA